MIGFKNVTRGGDSNKCVYLLDRKECGTYKLKTWSYHKSTEFKYRESDYFDAFVILVAR